MTLFEETYGFLQYHGYKPEDIIYIGDEEGTKTTDWTTFEKIAAREYDSGYGCQEVMGDLVIHLKDGAIMIRYEYDGAEGWQLIKPVPSVDLATVKPLDETDLFFEAFSEMINDLEDEEPDENYIDVIY